MDLVRIPSNISYFWDLQNRIDSSLSEDHRATLRDTPFYGYLNVPDVPGHPLVVDCLLEVFDAGKCSFKIGGKWTYFGIEDVGRITGLPMRGSIVDTRLHRTDRDTIYKHVLSFRSKTEIEEDMKTMTRSGKKKINEAKKKNLSNCRGRMGDLIEEMAERRDPLLPQMLVAFIIGFILCPQASVACPLFAYRYAENLDTLKEYNWAEVVYNVLVNEMTKAKKTKAKKFEGKTCRGGKRSRGGYMGGFASVLVIWFYELVGRLSLRAGAESLPPLLSFHTCPKSLRRKAVQALIRDPDNFRENDIDSRALKVQKRISEAAKRNSEAGTSTTEAAPSKIKGKVITVADLDRLIDEKKVELDLLLKMKRELCGGQQEEVESDSGDEDEGDDDDDDGDSGDEEGGNDDDDDREAGAEEGGNDDVDDREAGAEEGGNDDVDDREVGDEEGGNDDVDDREPGDEEGRNDEDDDGDCGTEVDDAAFVVSPCDIAGFKGKSKTPSIKRTVLSRSRLAGPSIRSPFVPIVDRKGVPNYPGRKEVRDDEREVLDKFWKEKNMAM